MKDFRGDTLSWSAEGGVIELVLDRAPCNEIGSTTLTELEKFTAALELLQTDCHALIISSPRAEGFCAGADLRELYHRSQALPWPRSSSSAPAGLDHREPRWHHCLSSYAGSADRDHPMQASTCLHRPCCRLSSCEAWAGQGPLAEPGCHCHSSCRRLIEDRRRDACDEA